MERFKHVDNYKLENAKLFGDRFSAIDYVVPDNARYLEVGVGDGHYSENVVSKKSLRSMHLLDFFNNDHPSGTYTSATHKEFIQNKFINNSPTLFAGNSADIMPQLIPGSYDYIYLDASHDYDGVLTEINAAAKLCSTTGVIGVNDYTYYSPHDGEFYGVVEAVNTFLYENPEWMVLAFQLGHLGYSDIYITRP